MSPVVRNPNRLFQIRCTRHVRPAGRRQACLHGSLFAAVTAIAVMALAVPDGRVMAQTSLRADRYPTPSKNVVAGQTAPTLQWRDLATDRYLDDGAMDLERLKARFDLRSLPSVDYGATSDPTTAAKSAGSLFASMQELDVPVEGNQYAYPALVTLPSGDILMVYKDWGVFPDFWNGPPTDPAKIYQVRSTDGGSTWSQATVIDEGDFPLDFNFLELTRLGTGRILLNDLTPFEPDHYYYSDDDGVTWTAAPITERYYPEWHGPIDGKVWYSYVTESGRDPVYRSSPDGLTWAAAKVIMDNVAPQRYDLVATAIAQGSGANVIAAIRRWDNDTGEISILIVRSPDGGVTWSGPAPLSTEGLFVNPTAMERDADGKLWLVAQGAPDSPGQDGNPFAGRDDIYYWTSDDDGQTWSAPTKFTSYLGADYMADVTITPAGPLVAFTSDRVAPQGIAYGVAGVTPDASAPPAVANWVFPYDGIPAGEEVPFHSAAAAESGIASAHLVVSVNGEEAIVPLSKGDPACQDYYLAEEYCWSGSIGPFVLGSEVTVRTVATDNQGRSASSYADAVGVIAVHNVGSVYMPVSPSGWIGEVRLAGNDYMCCGGAWAGTSKDGGTWVDEYTWSATDGFIPTMAPGESDLDITVSYDDGGILGLDVVQNSYQWADGPRSNGLVLEYEYTNNGTVGDIGSLYAAVHLDADLVNHNLFWDDWIAYSTGGQVIYMWDSGRDCVIEGEVCPDGYIGLAVIRDATGRTGQTLAPHTATINDWSASPYTIMTRGIDPVLTAANPPEPGDYRMVLTAKPFPLASGASQKVAFALVTGYSPAELGTNADAIASAYTTLVTGVEHTVGSEVPSDFRLEQNFPNPFNPSTTFSFALPRASKAVLSVYNLLGQEVATLVSGDLAAGVHDVRWDAAGLPSGVYVYRLEAGDHVATNRMVLLK